MAQIIDRPMLVPVERAVDFLTSLGYPVTVTESSLIVRRSNFDPDRGWYEEESTFPVEDSLIDRRLYRQWAGY